MEELNDFRVEERGAIGNVEGSQVEQARSSVDCLPGSQTLSFGKQPWSRRAQRTDVKTATTKTKTFLFTSRWI